MPSTTVPLSLILLTTIPLTIFLVATLGYLAIRGNPFATLRTRRHKLQSNPDTALKTRDIEHALPTVETVAQRREMRVVYQQAQEVVDGVCKAEGLVGGWKAVGADNGKGEGVKQEKNRDSFELVMDSGSVTWGSGKSMAELYRK